VINPDTALTFIFLFTMAAPALFLGLFKLTARR
jgi:hypothetical protein